VSPRPYRLGQRKAATERSRASILAAARQLLTGKTGFSAFTIDRVAKQAGVARMTVYYQFRGKRGLLEALNASLAARSGMDDLPEAFRKSDPLQALLEFVGIFIRFWSSDRLAMRRLHALSALDPEITDAVEANAELRRQGLQVIVNQVKARYGHPTSRKLAEAVEVLQMLTSFETFDHLAGTSRKPNEVGDTVMRLAIATVVLYGAPIEQ
jgi:AcrR family transcriptional regulator